MKKLISIEPDKNRFRQYSVTVVKTLFGYAVVREWGRIGQKPRAKEQHFSLLSQAETSAERIIRTRQRHGYKSSQ